MTEQNEMSTQIEADVPKVQAGAATQAAPTTQAAPATQMAPAISVLVPIYNVEAYLRECLDSLLAQTFTDFEVILINDGSTDSSRDIIEEYVQRDPRFKVIDKANSGYGASMNMGLDAACGKYLAILESDDFIEPVTFERMHEAIVVSGAQVVKANFWLYWSKPAPKQELFELVRENMVGRVVNPQEEHDIFYKKPSIWSALYLRSFLKEGDIRFLETPGASYQDAGFNFKVWTSATRVIFLHEAYLYYRQDNETSSVNSRAKVYCVCDEYEEMERFLDLRPDQLSYLAPILTKMRYDSYMWNYERLTEEFQPEFLEVFQRDFLRLRDEGKLDYELFESWKVADVNSIMTSPAHYHAHRTSSGGSGRVAKAFHYLRTGGPALVFKIIMSRLRKESY